MFSRHRRWCSWSVCTLIACFIVLTAERHSANAKTSFDSPYTFAQTYNAAVRLVRVDLRLDITEQNPAGGYILFDYKSRESGGRAAAGSIEMIDAGQRVKVLVQLGQMPRYHEQVLSDALGRKLRDEYGEPAKRAKADVPDAGSEPPPAP